MFTHYKHKTISHSTQTLLLTLLLAVRALVPEPHVGARVLGEQVVPADRVSQVVPALVGARVKVDGLTVGQRQAGGHAGVEGLGVGPLHTLQHVHAGARD